MSSMTSCVELEVYGQPMRTSDRVVDLEGEAISHDRQQFFDRRGANAGGANADADTGRGVMSKPAGKVPVGWRRMLTTERMV